MTDLTNSRKIQHINIVESDPAIDRGKHYFDTIHLTHRAMPEIDFQSVDPSVKFMGKRLSFPLLISSMTGGDHDIIKRINQNLALAAEETGVAMGVGSQRVMFTDPESTSSFAIRKFAPTALLFSNLGAVQLNYGFSVDRCKKAIETVQADAIYFHLNPLQEVIQPEGNTNFSDLGQKIGYAADALDSPVIVKEVGSGMSSLDVEILVHHGIRYIDVAGSGGTSWSRIEHYRQKPDIDNDTLGMLFQDWGIPTPLALVMLEPFREKITLISSGGIRNGIDMAKSIILGASLCGMASPFLHHALDSAEAVVTVIRRLKREYTTAMFLLGVDTFEKLHNNTSLIVSNLAIR